jgi:hypothetical protein
MTTSVAFVRLRQLQGFKASGKNQYEAHCPVHDDRKASLSIKIAGDGRILIHCHANCATETILDKLGLQTRDLFPEGNGNRQHPHTDGRIIATYNYTDADGDLSYQVVRYQPKDFRQRRPDGKGGWFWDTKGLKRLPYNLPELVKAEYVWICEGEKDCDNLKKIGLTAICNSGGAGKWTAELNQYFRPNQHITILPDNDKPGSDHSDLVALNLHGKVASLKILKLDGLPEKADVSDWLIERDPEAAAEELCRLSEAEPEWKPAEAAQQISSPHKFEQVTDDRFHLAIPDSAITFEIDRLRREHNELLGELCVRCTLPGVPTYDGALSIADFNLSSARARSERANLLAKRSVSKELDWIGYLEEFCQRVLAAERMGQPAIDLRSLDRPNPDDSIRIEGLSLPRRHPALIFGDGGAAKSYTGLYLGGCLVQQGLAVALFDWELAGEDHRDRLERLFGPIMPKILYARCERPLVYEADRLRRIVRDEKIDYAIFDSVAFACDGPPESAEIAGRYFRAVRQIGIGSLHIAHITKGEGGEEKPFGSVFWHNGARATWFAKIADSAPDGQTLSLGLFQKKANLGGLAQPTGFEIYFGKDRTHFSRKDPSDNPELAAKMPVRQRMIALLRQGAMSPEEIAIEIDAKLDTIEKTVRRHKLTFTVLEGGKVALLQRITA